LKEQEKQLSGVYDEETTVKVGKMKGARYAFWGTPYIKRSHALVELSCRMMNIENGTYVGNLAIVAIPMSELPDDPDM
jgi:hypothetical protein